MRTELVSVIACLNIGLCLTVFYANGEACHPGWITSTLIVAMLCYFLISFLMSKLIAKFNPKSFVQKQFFSLGYFVAPLWAYFSDLLIVKMAVKH
jgi:hypothetical protein